MKIEGPYKLTIRGNTADLRKVSGTTFPAIGYQFQRLLTGEEAAIERELGPFGIRVELDDGFVTVPRYPDSVTIAPTPEQIEAGWQVLDRAGIEAPEVEVMAELWAAMKEAE